MNLEVTIQGRSHKLNLERNPQDGSFICRLDDETWAGTARLLQPGILSLLIGGKSYCCVLEGTAEEPAIVVEGERCAFRVEDPRSLKARRFGVDGGSGPRPIRAPMPGRVVRVLAEQGSEVLAQQGVIVIEAMKMQNELKAPKAGRVAELRAILGATVNAGEVLAIVE